MRVRCTIAEANISLTQTCMCESISSTFCIACFLAASSSFPPSIYASLPFWCVKYSRLSNPFWKMYKIHQHQNPTNLTWVGWCNPLRIRNQCWILNEKSIIVCLQLFFVYSFDQPEGVFYRRYTVKRYLKKNIKNTLLQPLKDPEKILQGMQLLQMRYLSNFRWCRLRLR